MSVLLGWGLRVHLSIFNVWIYMVVFKCRIRNDSIGPTCLLARKHWLGRETFSPSSIAFWRFAGVGNCAMWGGSIEGVPRGLKGFGTMHVSLWLFRQTVLVMYDLSMDNIIKINKFSSHSFLCGVIRLSSPNHTLLLKPLDFSKTQLGRSRS